LSGSVAAVIPVRIGSARLPAKPLLQETGKSLIEHVHERVSKSRELDRIIVATDDQRIFDTVTSFGGTALMTSPGHRTGTDRVAEVARKIRVDAVINVQGDEPEVDPDDLDRLARAIRDDGGQMATLATPIVDAAVYLDRHAVKVVVDQAGNALYFSRSPVPWAAEAGSALATKCLRKHIGVYAYTRETLLRFTELPPPAMETLESLEQLRALFHGITIRVLETDNDPIGIDTPEDYQRFVEKNLTREAP